MSRDVAPAYSWVIASDPLECASGPFHPEALRPRSDDPDLPGLALRPTLAWGQRRGGVARGDAYATDGSCRAEIAKYFGLHFTAVARNVSRPRISAGAGV